MLEKQNIDSSKSETLHFPNVSTLMKISLGLILFTMISTVLVYAQTSDDPVIQILENGYLEDGLYYQLLQEHSTRLALNKSCDQASSAYQKSRVIFTNYQTEVIKEYVDFNFKMDVADYLPLM